MRLKPYNINELGPIYKKTKNYEILKEFKDSGLVCAEIEKHGHVCARYCCNSLTSSIKRFGFTGIKVCARKERVFLVNENLMGITD